MFERPFRALSAIVSLLFAGCATGSLVNVCEIVGQPDYETPILECTDANGVTTIRLIEEAVGDICHPPDDYKAVVTP
jgi:hypothetical protein